MPPRLASSYRAARRNVLDHSTAAWDAWREANAKADLPSRIVLAREEKMVIERARAAADHLSPIGVATLSEQRKHVEQALITLRNKRKSGKPYTP